MVQNALPYFCMKVGHFARLKMVHFSAGSQPPSSLPCDPAHPPIPVEKFQAHVAELMADRREKLKNEYKVNLPTISISINRFPREIVF